MSFRSTGRAASISALMKPTSIAILGASARRISSGNEALRNLIAAGYPSEAIHLVHPTADWIDGRRTVPSLRDLPTVPDVALLASPLTAVPAALTELEALGCPAAIVPGAGLAPDEQAELRAIAESAHIAVHGNNCMGVLSIADEVPLWFYEGILTDLPAGPIAIVSQSGSATFLARAVEGAGFSRVISTGNEIGLTSADYLDWLADDPATEVVGLVVESVRDVTAFSASVARLRQAGKPLAVLKVGRTDEGAKAAVAHTGAVASSAAAARSYFQRLDVPLVADYDELAATLQVLAAGIRPRGQNVAVITDSGGQAALTADLAVTADVRIPPFRPETIDRLQRLVPHAKIGNPFDAGASPFTTDQQYEDAFVVAASDPGIDAVAVILEAAGSAPRSEALYAASMMGGGIARIAETGKPVIAVSSTTATTHPASREALGGVPLVRGISPGLVALRGSAGNRTPLPIEHDRPSSLPTAQQVAQLRDLLSERGDGVLPDGTARGLLSAYGIEMVPSTIVETAEEGVEWAEGRYPVVVKISSPDIAHRSDIGAVVTGVRGPEHLSRAVSDILAAVERRAPSAVVKGVEIQEQVSSGHEAIVGLASDPVFGPAVVVGSGGIFVELFDDAQLSVVPVTHAEASRLVDATTLRAMMDGHRSLSAQVSTSALAELVQRVSWLGHDMRGLVDEMDLNPVIIDRATGQPMLVDVLITKRAALATKGVPA